MHRWPVGTSTDELGIDLFTATIQEFMNRSERLPPLAPVDVVLEKLAHQLDLEKKVFLDPDILQQAAHLRLIQLE